MELKDEILENITGGVYTEEAKTWITNNYKELSKRCADLGKPEGTMEWVNFVYDNSLKTYDLNAVQTMFKCMGVDISDLK